jgi:HEAT repeat protein
LSLVHYRGTREEYDLGLEYCKSSDPDDRATGADVLAQLGWGDEAFLQETVSVLIPMLQDSDAYVSYCAAVALGHRWDPKAIPHLIEISEHKDPQVRNGVVFGLLGHEDPEAIHALIRLSRDSDDEVRNWALFGLGAQIDTDTPEIRNALFKGLNDPGDEARGEAMVGLAKRGDPRVVDSILKEWEGKMIGILSLQAAETIGDSRLLPHLEGFQKTMELEDTLYKKQLEEAIVACRLKTEQVVQPDSESLL